MQEYKQALDDEEKLQVDVQLLELRESWMRYETASQELTEFDNISKSSLAKKEKATQAFREVQIEFNKKQLQYNKINRESEELLTYIE